MAVCEMLLARAGEMLPHSYAPYSGFPVAAVIRTADGREFAGVNIENEAYGLSLCAERAALACMVTTLGPSARIAVLAIASAKGNPCYPCGACRQMLLPFSTVETLVALRAHGEEAPVVLKFSELLPHPFSRTGKTP